MKFSRSTMQSKLLPKSSSTLAAMVIMAACVTSTTKGYDGSMMGSLNALPSYTDYFALNTATRALNTCAVWIGGLISSVMAGMIANKFGRVRTLQAAALWTIFAAIFQTAAQGVAMFVFGGVFIGFGITLSMVAAAAYAAETLPSKLRGWGVGLLGDLYYVGSLISSGVTYGTAQMDSTWAWRLPSALQGLFSLTALLVLFIVPESPRWLVMQDRNEEALQVVAMMHADGDVSHPDTLLAFAEIQVGMEFEQTEGRQASFGQIFKTPDLRMRVILVFSASVCAMIIQNIILNAWCLLVSILGTYTLDRFGRKTIALISNSSMVVLLFLVGGLTAAFGTSSNESGIYGTVAMIFLFQGVYSLAWTPLIMLYPPEILTYSMRVYGVGLMEFLGNCFGLLIVFAFPFAFAAIGWKFFMINATWDILEVAFVAYFWIKTVGLTLEQINEKMLRRFGNVTEIEGLDVTIKEKEEFAVKVTDDLDHK